MHLTKAVRSVIAHPGKKAHWDMLHKSLHPDEEDRWHQDDKNSTYERDRGNLCCDENSSCRDDQQELWV